ncbi:rhodanese-like domain-containing protein [Hydrogenophaga sp.]|jgi:Fe-Mn family superoxide dismutase|uniref:rhodanese-like domain-containing protein n=1 Tax=Hydrogenophaga sp. TaxID=1904254 RepID=UPI003F715A23
METHTLEPANEALVVEHADVAGSLVLDVRRVGAFEQATTQLPGATWHDPAAVAQWAASIPRDRPVTVYCVHGHEVSRDTALHLRASGVDARYLRGGIEGWREAGMPVVPKRDLP